METVVRYGKRHLYQCSTVGGECCLAVSEVSNIIINLVTRKLSCAKHKFFITAALCSHLCLQNSNAFYIVIIKHVFITIMSQDSAVGITTKGWTT
jgi:hypothetical protein